TLGKVPSVLSLRESLQQWLQHRKEVLIRRSDYRLNEIDCRLEILQGYLIAYLNLNEVIQIIREHDEAKKELILRFKLTENQAESILNMRLRSLRKLE
ncbi:MAG: DNA gyrase subunit A, partial [Bartonella sp.]|nr:DNA gyrase subunit A [Bartonella sp.]